MSSPPGSEETQDGQEVKGAQGEDRPPQQQDETEDSSSSFFSSVCRHDLTCNCATTLLAGFLFGAMVLAALAAAHRQCSRGPPSPARMRSAGLAAAAAAAFLASASAATSSSPVRPLCAALRVASFPLWDRAAHHPAVFASCGLLGAWGYLVLRRDAAWLLEGRRKRPDERPRTQFAMSLQRQQKDSNLEEEDNTSGCSTTCARTAQ